MVSQRSRADLVHAALESADRTWRLGDVEVQVTQLAWDEAKNRVTVDARVIYQGELIADDRWHFVNPPLRTHDGTYVTQFRYESNFGDVRWATVEERDAMSASEKREFRATGISRQHPRLGYDPLKALQNSFVETARIVTKGWTRRRLERIGLSDDFRGDTLSVRSGTADGSVEDADTTWASTQNGPGEATTTTGNIQVKATRISGTNWQLRQCFLGWDTSSIDDGATVTDFDITLYADAFGVADTDAVTFELYIYDWGGTVGTDDYRDCSPSTNITNLTKMASIALSSWTDTSNAANALSSTAATGSISKTGTTYMVGLFDISYGGTPTGNNTFQFRSADEAGTDYDPLLVVTYSTPVTGTIAATLQKAVFSGSGTQTQTGTIAATLLAATAAFVGAMQPSGTVAATMQAATFAGSGTHTAGATGTMAATMQAATASMGGEQPYSGPLAATMQEPTFAGVGAMQPEGAMAATLIAPSFAGVATQAQTGAIAAALQAALFSGVATHAQTGTIAATLQALTFSGVALFYYPDATGTVSDSYAFGGTTSDAFAYGGTLSDAFAHGLLLSDDFAYGGTIDDDYTHGGTATDG